MARPESVALGGYYPTPEHLIPLVAGLVDVRLARGFGSSEYTVIDPCAGEGRALRSLCEQWWGSWEKLGYNQRRPRVYACELEQERFNKLAKWGGGLDFYARPFLENGDAFQIAWGDEPSGQVLFLNPPYDTDKEYGRLEHRFLHRFTQLLRPGAGILLYVAPHYALSASTRLLAEEYEQVHCFRFPDGDFEVFKQVVLVARRRHHPDPFAARSPIVAMVQQWASDPASMPVLTGTRPVVALPETGAGVFQTWKLLDVDVRGAYEQYGAWRDGKGRPIYGYDLELGMDELIGSRYPVVLPPKPAHTAIALASGLVNGREVAPDRPESGLPRLLVKGVFDREFQTVEERKDKEGNIKSVIQVEQPKLRVNVLDMETWLYHELADGIEPSGATAVARMNVADLLTHYGLALADLMRQQCPPLHDPADPTQAIQLPPMKLNLYGAQKHLVMAGLKQFFTGDLAYAGESPFVLGEVGTGKTAVSLTIINALSPANYDVIKSQLAAMGIAGGRIRPVSRVLVVCPPHLLAGWTHEIEKFTEARVQVLSRISDVIQARRDVQPGLTVYLLSREMAKLGHTWEDGRWLGRCPSCGRPFAGKSQEIVAKRLWCEHRPYLPLNNWARWSERVAGWLVGVSGSHYVESLVNGRISKMAFAKVSERSLEERQALWLARVAPSHIPLAATPIGKMLSVFYGRIQAHATSGDFAAMDDDLRWLRSILKVFDHPERDSWIADCIHQIYPQTLRDRAQYGGGQSARRSLQNLLPMMKGVGGALQTETFAQVRRWHGFDLAELEGQLERLKDERRGGRSWRRQENEVTATEDSILFGWGEGVALGSVKAADALLHSLVEKGEWKDGRECHTPLFQAVPQPRRVPLSDYISRYAQDLFDLLVVDEAHEYAHDGSAQERAAHRLMEMGKPVLALTGTSNNGYASSLFANMWAMSPRFRSEFGREDKSAFTNRYGYRKVKVEPEDGSSDWVARYGAMSDLVDTGDGLRRRKIGEAPGVNPLFILKHMLPSALLLHKGDLDVDLPPLREIREGLQPDEDLLTEYDDLETAVMEAVQSEWASGSAYAGRLWGCVAQLPFYLDRAHEDTGNEDYEQRRRFVFRFPLSDEDERGGKILAATSPLPTSVVTEKERWMLSRIGDELAQGRRVMVFTWNTGDGTLPRRWLQLVNDEFGRNTAVFLDAQKVSAPKRQDWIDRMVIGKQRKVLFVNPRAVETGLNNLVYFHTAIWAQNPNCSPIIYQQANGRIHRPGQEADEVRVYVPYYANTSQSAQMELLAQKVQASKQTDGLDVTSALLAAGAGGADSLNVMSVGKAIYELLLRGKRPYAANSVKVHHNGYWGGNGGSAMVVSSVLSTGVQMSLF